MLPPQNAATNPCSSGSTSDRPGFGTNLESDNSSPIVEKENELQPRISAQDLQIPDAIMCQDSLEKIFRDAEAILHEKDLTADIPSTDPLIKAVRNEAGIEPLIVKPQKKIKNIFECTCKVYSSLRVICHHSLAVSQVNGKLLEYLMEVKRSVTASAKQLPQLPNVTAGMNKGLPIELQGMKKNKVSKAAQRNRRNEQQRKEKSFTIIERASTTQTSKDPENANQAVDSTQYETHQLFQTPIELQQPRPGIQIQQQQEYQQQLQLHSQQHQNQQLQYQQPLYQYATQSLTSINNDGRHEPPKTMYATLPMQPPQFMPIQHSSFAMPTNTQSQQLIHWHSGMSPFAYEIMLFPVGVSKCYGCGKSFADKYKQPPHNLIIRLKDR